MKLPEADYSKINVGRAQPLDEMSVRELLTMGFKGLIAPNQVAPGQRGHVRSSEQRVRENQRIARIQGS